MTALKYTQLRIVIDLGMGLSRTQNWYLNENIWKINAILVTVFIALLLSNYSANVIAIT